MPSCEKSFDILHESTFSSCASVADEFISVMRVSLLVGTESCGSEKQTLVPGSKIKWSFKKKSDY